MVREGALLRPRRRGDLGNLEEEEQRGPSARKPAGGGQNHCKKYKEEVNEKMPVIISYNCSSWPGLQAFLAKLASVEEKNKKDMVDAEQVVAVLVQEHHVIESRIAECSATLLGMGWQSVWGPAVILDSGAASGGVCVLCRPGLGLKNSTAMDMLVDMTPVQRARVVSATIQFEEDLGELDLISLYLRDGAGMSSENLELLGVVGTLLPRRQVVVGGDFNLAASVIVESGFCGHSGLTVQAPPADQPTHRSAAGTHNIIDFFLVSSGLAEVGPATTTDETIDFRPHRPIKLILPNGFGHRWMRSWVLPPALPRLRVFGPLLPARAGYEEVATDCMHTLNRVEGLNDTEVQRRLSQAYQQWAGLAEHDLEHITGTEPRGRQHRGRMVRLAWRRVLCTDRLSALAPLSRAGRIRRIYHQAELAACSLAGLRFADAGRQWSQAVVAWHSFVVDDGDEFLDEAWLRLQRAFDTAKAGMESMEVVNLAEDEAVAEDIDELFACIAEWAGMSTQAGKDQKNHERREWRQWARDALEQGARRAHRHMKKGEQRWMATLVPDLAACGGRSAAPVQVLEHELAKWAAVWDAEPQDEDRPRPFLPPGLPARGFGGQGSPALATPQGLREVARSFKSTTAMTADGFHMSHYAMLSDASLQALAALFAITDATGLVPKQIARIVCPMLPKKNGGCRLIGLYPSYYRLWAKSWGPVIARWERDIEEPWMTAVRGQSPTSLVYRTAVEAEHAAARGRVVGAVCMDIAQFYEHINHAVLVGRAVASGFPMGTLRGAVRSYRLARYIVSGCAVARPVAAEKGVVAGDSFATSLVKAYYKAPFETMLFRWQLQGRSAAFDVYLDDITLANSNESAAAVADELIECAGDVIEVIEQDLGASVAKAKTQVVSNNMVVTRRVSRALGVLGPVRVSDPFVLLGVDLVMANRWRPRARKSQQAGRMSSALRRHSRAGIFRRLAGSKAAVLYKSGVRSVAAHGMECTGLADGPLKRLRTCAKDFLCPTRCSISATLLLDSDPTLECAVAAAIRWAREAWMATVDARCLSLPRMRRIFEDIAAKGVGSSWSDSRGPVSAAHLELCRLGWSWPSAFCFIDDMGSEWVLTSTSPAMMMNMMKASRKRQLARTLAEKVGVPHPIDPTPVHKVLASGRLLDNERQRVCLRRTFQGAVVTNTRLREMGYDVSATCPLCGRGEDTLKHRVLFCGAPVVAALRDEVLPSELAEAVGDMQEHEVAGWSYIDAVAWPAPVVGHLLDFAHFEQYHTDLDVWVSIGMDKVQEAIDVDEAKLFTDGSLMSELWPSAARAGWGVAVATPTRPLVRAFGPVTGQVQTVPAAEWAAVEVAARFWPAHRPKPVWGLLACS